MKKALLSFLAAAFLVSPFAARGEDITYTGHSTDLKPAPDWTYFPGSHLYPGTQDNPGASGNTVTIDYDPATGSVTHPNRVFGVLSQSETSNNTVNMINGQIGNGSGDGGLYDGYVRSPSGTATASGNTINFSGGNVNANDNFIRGGYASSDDTATASGNTVNISGGTFKAGIYNRITGGLASPPAPST